MQSYARILSLCMCLRLPLDIACINKLFLFIAGQCLFVEIHHSLHTHSLTDGHPFLISGQNEQVCYEYSLLFIQVFSRCVLCFSLEIGILQICWVTGQMYVQFYKKLTGPFPCFLVPFPTPTKKQQQLYMVASIWHCQSF